MKKLSQLIPLLLILVIIACNGPKKLTKKGNSLADAGIHKEAVELYLKALNKDRAHVAAIQGLRTSGGAVLNSYQSDFFRAYSNSDYKKAVYTYKEMEQFQARLNKMNADLKIPRHYQDDYADAKTKYLEQRFEEANELMAQENFIGAENIFKEITKIEPNYGGEDLNNLMEISKLEPPYRNGNNQLDFNKNRAAYHAFKKVVKINPTYKDSKLKMEEALELAQYTIAVLKFKNFSYERGSDEKVSSIMIGELLKNKGPFLKIIDRSIMDRIINEQYLAMNGWMSGNGAVKTGELLGAKAILSGKVISVTNSSQAARSKIVRGYKKRVVKTYNQSTAKTTTKVLYDKVNYKNYKGHNSVKVLFQFMLVSSETGEVLLSEIIEKSIVSEIDYNTYSGNYKDLVPGNWDYTWKKTSRDKIDHSKSGKTKLREKFKSNKTLRAISSISNEVFIAVGKAAAKKVYLFNPE
jgi:tetratricopeptide (TPR) repeat protein